MPQRNLGLVVAVPEEAVAILADPLFAWREAGAGLYSSNSFPMKLVVSGVGKVFASWALARLLAAWEGEGGCDLVCSLGTSGALGDQAVGSLWLVGEFVEQDMDASGLGFERGVTPFSGMDSPMLRTLGPGVRSLALETCAVAGLSVGETRSVSGDCFIADGARARSLGERYAAALCDMESAALAKLCAFRAGPGPGPRAGAGGRAAQPGGPGLPFFALRSVSDNADHKAPRSWPEQVKLASLDLDSFLRALAARL
jgi:nucleoside phosphorylase